MYSKKIVFYIVLVSAIPTIANIFNPGTVGIPQLIAQIFISYFLYNLYVTKQYELLDGKRILKLWLIILFFGVVRAFSINYSSYEGIRDSLLALLNIATVYCIYLGGLQNTKNYLKAFFIITLPCAIISSVKWNAHGLTDVAHILYPISLFLLLIPYVSKKCKITLIAITLYSFFHDISVRSNVLLLGFSIILLTLYFISKYHYKIRFRKITWIACFITPIIFLFLGISGRYNFFTELMSTKINISGGGKDRTYMVDSRTAVYEDVFRSFDGTGSLIFGNSPVTKIKTQMNIKERKEGRNRTESGFLNILYYYGIIGILCYMYLSMYASYLAIFRANNKLATLIGLYVAFKFLFIFIEEPNITMTTYFAIGLCLNSVFRNMSEDDVKQVMQGKTQISLYNKPSLDFVK